MTTTEQPPCFLDEREVRARLRMPELIEAMQRALTEFSAGRVTQPVRTVFRFGEEHSLFGLMPSWVPSLPALGAKLVTVCHSNASRGLGTHQAMIVMLDPVTGVVKAVLDGRYITEVRTAAVSAVSARLLARNDAQVLGILGSGVQARSHLEALRLVRNFREVRVWSPSPEHLAKFAAETGAQAMDSPECVVHRADVVVTATASATPVVRSEWVNEGTHVIAVGSCVPTQRELDPALVARARLIVDSRAAALKEAGDVVMGIAEGRWTVNHIAAELGELPVRENDREITIFKSLGLAVEDLFAAHLVLTNDQALQRSSAKVSTNRAKPGLFMIGGRELVSVNFTLDYIQFQFGDLVLAALAGLTLFAGGESWSPADTGFRDALCRQIKKLVRSTAETETLLTITFDDQSRIEIPLDARSGENAMLSGEGTFFAAWSRPL